MKFWLEAHWFPRKYNHRLFSKTEIALLVRAIFISEGLVLLSRSSLILGK